MFQPHINWIQISLLCSFLLIFLHCELHGFPQAHKHLRAWLPAHVVLLCPLNHRCESLMFRPFWWHVSGHLISITTPWLRSCLSFFLYTLRYSGTWTHMWKTFRFTSIRTWNPVRNRCLPWSLWSECNRSVMLLVRYDDTHCRLMKTM